MLAWGACGLLGGLAAPLLRRRLPLALTVLRARLRLRRACMDVWEWLSFSPAHLAGLRRAVRARGLRSTCAHATGNSRARVRGGAELRRLPRSATRGGSGRRSDGREARRPRRGGLCFASTPAGYSPGAAKAANGGFAEPTGSSGPLAPTAWGRSGLKAAGDEHGRSARLPLRAWASRPRRRTSSLVAMAESAEPEEAGPALLTPASASARRSSGAIGPTVSSTMGDHSSAGIPTSSS